MNKNGVFNNLVDRLSDLPGIGKKTAQRLAFYLMKMKREDAFALAGAITDVKEKISNCSVCFNLTETNPCPICSDTKRDSAMICVVENPSDVNALEKTGIYRGLYHVLGGALSPLDNIGPDDIHVTELLKRVKDNGIKELIIATNPTVEGEATAGYIAGAISESGVHITRIARGLPVGSDLELADTVTLIRSFEGRLNAREEKKEDK